MSEHQYYEFRAVDRPPGRTEQRELRAISTRAQITAAGFVNHCEWGDFKGNPDRLMSRYFDLFLHLANWGSRRLSIRLPTIARREAGLCRGGGPGLLAFDGAIDGVDQHLGLDKFDPRPLGLVAIERRGKRLCEGVAVIGHTLARLFQRLKSLAHVGFAFCYSRVSYWREKYGQEPLVDAGPEQNSDDTMVKPGSVRHGKCRRVDLGRQNSSDSPNCNCWHFFFAANCNLDYMPTKVGLDGENGQISLDSRQRRSLPADGSSKDRSQQSQSSGRSHAARRRQRPGRR